jgi:hypothetical protein
MYLETSSSSVTVCWSQKSTGEWPSMPYAGLCVEIFMSMLSEKNSGWHEIKFAIKSVC